MMHNKFPFIFGLTNILYLQIGISRGIKRKIGHKWAIVEYDDINVQLFFFPLLPLAFLLLCFPESPPAVVLVELVESLAGMCFCHFRGFRRYIGQGGIEIKAASRKPTPNAITVIENCCK